MFDKEEYYKYSKILEIISMIKFSIIILGSLTITYSLGDFIIKDDTLRIILGVIIGVALGYMSYLKEQIKVEEMRMNIENNNELKQINKKIFPKE